MSHALPSFPSFPVSPDTTSSFLSLQEMPSINRFYWEIYFGEFLKGPTVPFLSFPSNFSLKLGIAPGFDRSWNSDTLKNLTAKCREVGGHGLGPSEDSRLSGPYDQGSCYQMEQYASELVIFQQVISSSLLASPEEADILIVPRFAMSDCLDEFCWGPRARRYCFNLDTNGSCFCHCLLRDIELFTQKPGISHFIQNPENFSRHLFLGSADLVNLPMYTSTAPLLLSFGPKMGQGHVVVPPAVALQRRARIDINNKTTSIFVACNPDSNPYRKAIIKRLRSMQIRFEGRNVEMIDLKVDKILAEDLDDRRCRAVFCLVPPGDSLVFPRLFQAVDCLCIPILVGFPSVLPIPLKFLENFFDEKHVFASYSLTPDGPPLPLIMPFFDIFDYSSFAVILPFMSVLRKDTFNKAMNVLASLDTKKYMQNLKRVRSWLIYPMTLPQVDKNDEKHDKAENPFILIAQKLNDYAESLKCKNGSKMSVNMELNSIDSSSVSGHGWPFAYYEFKTIHC